MAVSPASLALTKGSDSGWVSVATIQDADLNNSPDAYQATLDWGDGSTTNGIVTGSTGSFQVLGDHTYASAGSFTVEVAVADVDGDSATSASPATVANTASLPTDGGAAGSNPGATAPTLSTQPQAPFSAADVSCPPCRNVCLNGRLMV
jgi:hypothetical protein